MDVAEENIHPRQRKIQFIQTFISTRRILLGEGSSDVGNVLIYIYKRQFCWRYPQSISHGLIMTSQIFNLSQKIWGITRRAVFVCADRVSRHQKDLHPAWGHYHPDLQFPKSSGCSRYSENHKNCTYSAFCEYIWIIISSCF